MRRNIIRGLNSHARLLSNTITTNYFRKIHQIKANVNNSGNDNTSKVSTLYVPGRYGANVYQIVKPEIDVSYIETNLSAIDKSCSLRGIKLDIHHVVRVLNEWSVKRNEHLKLVEKLRDYEDDIKRLKELNLMEESETVKQESNECLKELKLAKESLYDIEDVVMPLVQCIPNVIENSTPIESDVVEIITPASVENKAIPHVVLANRMSLLDFMSVNPPTYYLKGCLAELELEMQHYFSSKLQHFKFVPLSCIDFCKSFILEAVGLDPYSYNHCIPLKNNKSFSEIGQKLNVVGGASFESFCAYLINMNVDSSVLPTRYFSVGRHYEAYNRCCKHPSLFSVVQSSRVQCVVLSHPSTENDQFDTLFDSFLSCYLPIKIPLRTVDVAAPHLNITESRRKLIELWSAAEHRYIPVAHVSQRKDFVSKRLHISYGIQHDIHGYCSIIEGAAVEIPVLLGCILEHYQKPDGTITFDDIFKVFTEFD